MTGTKIPFVCGRCDFDWLSSDVFGDVGIALVTTLLDTKTPHFFHVTPTRATGACVSP